MNILLLVVTLIFFLSVVNLFEHDDKVTKKSGNVIHFCDLDATTTIDTSSSKNFISDMEEIGFECTIKRVIPLSEALEKISDMEELGFECIIKRVIPLSEALENNTNPIAEVLLDRIRGCYSICAVFENDLLLSPAFYFVGEKDILLVVFALTK